MVGFFLISRTLLKLSQNDIDFIYYQIKYRLKMLKIFHSIKIRIPNKFFNLRVRPKIDRLDF